MKFRVLLAALVLTASATSAMAAGPYIGVSAGASMFHDSDLDFGGFTEELSYDLGGAVNISAGFDLDGVRLEGEFGYKRADVDSLSGFGSVDGDVTVMSFMANGFYDFKTGSAFTPFVGIGIGLLNGELDDTVTSSDDTTLGYQLSVGGGFKLAPNVNLDLNYRYQAAIDDFTVEGTDVSYSSSNFLAGVRVGF